MLRRGSSMYRCMLVVATVATACGRYGAQATVTIAVTGPGVVRTSNLEGDCHATCWFSVEREVPVRLEPVASSRAVFVGWSGACSGTGPCDLKPAVDVSVAATFAPTTPHRLQVSLNGSGEVRSDPPGIDCPRICAADFPEGTPVSLFASAAAGWGFTGFDGACAGSGCTVALGADAAAVATFVQNPVQLAVQVGGGGRVFSTPGAIDCPGVCSAIFAPGTALRLTASAAAGSTFAGFSGACSGAACSLRLSTSAAVFASFSAIPMFKVAVVLAGGGVGRVISNPPAIDCPGNCEARFPEGAAVTLSATPDPLSRFARFGGSCGGAGCSLTLSADAAIVAQFEPRRYQVVDLGLPSGGSWSAPAGISRKGTLVAGTWGGAQQMFIWDGAMHDSAFAPAYVAAVNDNGVVVGAAPAGYDWHAFRWKGDSATDLGTLGGAGSNALAINRDGTIVGWAQRPDGQQRAVSWSSDGMVDFGSFADAGCSVAYGINSDGVIVGSSCTPGAGVRAARFRGPGLIDDLGSLGGTTAALAISDQGLIVGYSYLPSGAYHGFLYADGKMIDAGSMPGMPHSQLVAVNGAGLAVGFASDGNGLVRGLVYGGGRMVDLNSVVDPTQYAVGQASGIDEAGNIAVSGVSGGRTRALLLRPSD